MARIYKRTHSGSYWIDYWTDGRRIRESTHTTNIKSAGRCLASRFGDVVQGKFNERPTAWNVRNQTGYLQADCNLSEVVDANDRSITYNNRNMATAVP